MTAYGPSARTFLAVYMERTRPRTRDMYTAVYTTHIRPRTRVYVYMALLYGRVLAIYTSENGSLRGRTRPCNVSCVRAVSARVHGSVRAVCTAAFGRVHWPYTRPFSAVYTARTRPCNGPCTRPCTRAVYTAGRPTGPCTRSQTARYSRVRPVTAYGLCTRVDEHVHGCVWDVYTTVYMARYGRVHGPRP